MTKEQTTSTAMQVDTKPTTTTNKPSTTDINTEPVNNAWINTLLTLHDQLTTMQQRGSTESRFLHRLTRTLFTAARPNLSLSLLHCLIQNHDPSLHHVLDTLKQSVKPSAEDEKRIAVGMDRLQLKRRKEAERRIRSEAEKQNVTDKKKKQNEKQEVEEEQKKKSEADDKTMSDVVDSTYLPPIPSPLPETSLFLQLCCLLLSIDHKAISFALQHATHLFNQVTELNLRSSDTLSARIYHYTAHVHEINHSTASIRDLLLKTYRTATLNHNYAGQAALINALLRNYIQDNLFHLADTFRSKISFPSDRFVCAADQARFEYYSGRLAAVQLHYSDAENHLQVALRKAPTGEHASAFRIAVTRLLILVELLMGEIPERSLYESENRRLQTALIPYLQLTRSVRVGNLENFNQVIQHYISVFSAAQHSSLIQRLRQNVIKTGLRKLNLSYSQLTLQQVAKHLKLEQQSDVESIVVKAISDGVIEARLEKHNDMTVLVSCIESLPVHSSAQESLHKRIHFTNQIYTDAVKALRFPRQANKAIAELGGADDDDSDEEEFKQRVLKKKAEKEAEEKKQDKK